MGLYKNAENSPIVTDPQGTLAKLFGFESNFRPPSGKNLKRMEHNESHRCLMCGQIKLEGTLDPKGSLINAGTNMFYDFACPNSPFVCDPCLYMYGHYMKKQQKDLDRVYGDIGNVVVFADRIEARHFNSDEKNELYDLFVDSPDEPFAVLIKRQKSASFDSNWFGFTPTVDPELIVFSFAFKEYATPRRLTIECMEEASAILELHRKRKLKVADDVLFNRAKNESHTLWMTARLRADPAFMEDWRRFIGRYDYGVRFAAKMMFKRFQKEKKERK